MSMKNHWIQSTTRRGGPIDQSVLKLKTVQLTVHRYIYDSTGWYLSLRDGRGVGVYSKIHLTPEDQVVDLFAAQVLGLDAYKALLADEKKKLAEMQVELDSFWDCEGAEQP